MPLPDDLKNFSADGFQFIEPQTAGAILFFAIALILVLERVGIL